LVGFHAGNVLIKRNQLFWVSSRVESIGKRLGVWFMKRL
jgi:hypothetical protein